MEYDPLDPVKFTFKMQSEQSDWQCYLFGSAPGNGIMWRPNKGQVPNAWWRFWQFVMFGNRWVKDRETRNGNRA